MLHKSLTGRRRARGFTLLEVLLSVAIFILLAGGIYAVVSVSISASTALAEERTRSERLDGLRRYLRELFLALPANANVDLQAVSSGRAAGVRLLLTPAPSCGIFCRTAEDQGIALAGLGEGRSMVVEVANFPVSDSSDVVASRLESATWIRLLPDVRSIRWRFAGSHTPGGTLSETWNRGNGRPALANLELVLSDGTSENWFFRIPDVSAAQGSTSRQP